MLYLLSSSYAFVAPAPVTRLNEVWGKEKTEAGGKKGRKRAVVSDMLARQRTANYLERKAQRKLEWSGVRKLALRPETSLANLTVGQWVDARVRGVNEKVCACGSLFLLYYYYYEPLS